MPCKADLIQCAKQSMTLAYSSNACISPGRHTWQSFEMIQWDAEMRARLILPVQVEPGLVVSLGNPAWAVAFSGANLKHLIRPCKG